MIYTTLNQATVKNIDTRSDKLFTVRYKIIMPEQYKQIKVEERKDGNGAGTLKVCV